MPWYFSGDHSVSGFLFANLLVFFCEVVSTSQIIDQSVNLSTKTLLHSEGLITIFFPSVLECLEGSYIRDSLDPLIQNSPCVTARARYENL